MSADLRVRVLDADHLALLGDPDLRLHGAARLREDGLVGGAAAAAHRAAAAVEQPQPHAVALERRDERDLRLEQLPARGQVPAVLVAVAVAQHHLLRGIARGEHARVQRDRQQLVHRARGIAQVGDRLEQRHDVAGEVRVDRAVKAHLAQQQHHLQDVGDAVALRDHVVLDAVGAVERLQARGSAQDFEFAPGLGRVLDVRRTEQPRRREFLGQHAHARGLVEGFVAHVRSRDGEQLRDDALVHVGVLAQVDRRQVEAEDGHGPPQLAQPPAGEQGRAVRLQRVVDRLEVGPELRRARVGRRLGDRVPQRRVLVEGARGGGDSRVDAGEGPSIRLVAAVRAGIGRTFRQREQFSRGAAHERGHGEFRAERVKLLEVVVEHARRLHAQRPREHLGGHERVAVAVAADPRADAQERRQLDGGLARMTPREIVLECTVELRQLGHERVLVERQPIRDLVEHVELLEPQHAGLPQREHRAPDRLVVGGTLTGRQPVAVTRAQQPFELQLEVAHALALHLRRVRGEHGHDQRVTEERGEGVATDARGA